MDDLSTFAIPLVVGNFPAGMVATGYSLQDASGVLICDPGRT